MDTKSGYPFWVIKNGLLSAYPPLAHDARCDVLVIGGGITGALVADHLSRHGHDVVVVEQRDVGWGSTAASTALLQYEIDAHMTELAERYDEATAALAYTSCVTATEALVDLARDLGDVGLQRCGSLYLAPARAQVRALVDEHSLRVRHGLPSVFMRAGVIAERYGIAAPAALWSSVAAVIDPYRFTNRLLARARRRGVRIFDRTRIAGLTKTARTITARTERGVAIRAGHVVVAAGYEAQTWLRQRVARNRSTYAFVSDPVALGELARIAKTIVWEAVRPYHYVRTTPDHRVLVGGGDDAHDDPAQRDRRVLARARSLTRYAAKLLPDVSLTRAFAWAGTFAETRDALPYFGSHAQHGDRVLFAMAYGGNGITYSMLGASLLRAIIERTAHPLRALFAFERYLSPARQRR